MLNRSKARFRRWLTTAIVLGAVGSAHATPQTPAVVLPLGFERNHGQLEPQIGYLARGRGYELALTSAGPRLRFAGQKAELVVRLVGAAEREPEGRTRVAGATNYLLGKDSRRWVTNVESYAQVAYTDVLPGVSWLFYGQSQRELEYDLVLAPGTGVSGLRLVFDGARQIQVDARGRLVIELSNGLRLEQSPPVAYQLDAEGRKALVAARYEMHGDGSLGFRVGQYDRARELVIDPTLTYATYFGGSGFEDARAVAVDGSGNVYLTGSTSLGLFPISGAAQGTYGGGSTDAFVCKLNASGSAIVYATFLGGSDADVANGIAVDPLGLAYVGGYTLSTDFPTAAALQASNAGSIDGFVTKLNSNGSAFTYSTYLGGSTDDFVNAVAVTPVGAARVAGTTYSANFPKVAATQPAIGGDSDAFVSYLNAPGSALTFSTFWGGGGTETGINLALDSAGAAYLVGSTGSGNFPLLGAFQTTYGGGLFDAFVTKLGAVSGVTYSSFLGGASRDEGTAIALDRSGAALVGGYTQSDGFPGASSGFQKTRAGGEDGFVSKVDPSGAVLNYSSYLGGSGNDRVQGVATDPRDNVVIAGFTDSTNFATLLPNQPNNAGANDAFLTRLLVNGTLDYSTYYGGSSNDRAFAVATNANGDVGIVGNTLSTNFPTKAALYATRVGSQDAFVLKVPGALGAPIGGAPFVMIVVLLGLGVVTISRRSRRLHA